MPRACAMVGHGGSGSTLIALAAGVPIAFVPLFVDGPTNAERVQELGAGIVAEDLARDVETLLVQPRHRAAARALAGEIAALPPATDAVALLERYASVRRRATATAAPSIAIAPATRAPAS